MAAQCHDSQEPPQEYFMLGNLFQRASTLLTWGGVPGEHDRIVLVAHAQNATGNDTLSPQDKRAVLLGWACYETLVFHVQCLCAECEGKPALYLPGPEEDKADVQQFASSIMPLDEFLQHADENCLSGLPGAGDLGNQPDSVQERFLDSACRQLLNVQIPAAAANASVTSTISTCPGRSSNTPSQQPQLLQLGDFLVRAGEVAGGARLIGESAWVHTCHERADEHDGAWQPARIVSFDASQGLHELQLTDTTTLRTFENYPSGRFQVSLALCHVCLGSTRPTWVPGLHPNPQQHAEQVVAIKSEPSYPNHSKSYPGGVMIKQDQQQRIGHGSRPDFTPILTQLALESWSTMSLGLQAAKLQLCDMEPAAAAWMAARAALRWQDAGALHACAKAVARCVEAAGLKLRPPGITETAAAMGMEPLAEAGAMDISSDVCVDQQAAAQRVQHAQEQLLLQLQQAS